MTSEFCLIFKTSVSDLSSHLGLMCDIWCQSFWGPGTKLTRRQFGKEKERKRTGEKRKTLVNINSSQNWQLTNLGWCKNDRSKSSGLKKILEHVYLSTINRTLPFDEAIKVWKSVGGKGKPGKLWYRLCIGIAWLWHVCHQSIEFQSFHERVTSIPTGLSCQGVAHDTASLIGKVWRELEKRKKVNLWAKPMSKGRGWNVICNPLIVWSELHLSSGHRVENARGHDSTVP